MKVIQILGLGHSGTTLLDRMIACHPGTIGLGEVGQMLDRERAGVIDRLNCPCGESARTCPYWSEVLSRPHDDPGDFFGHVVARAKALGYDALVDSTKVRSGIGHYRRFARRGEIDALKLVRLVRDPRGWVDSIMRREKVDRGDANGIRKLFYRWLLFSLRYDARAAAAADDAESCYVWYDKLIVDREEGQLTGLLGLASTEDGEIRIDRANQHAVTGNKFVFSEKKAHIRYDARWLANPEVDEIYAELAPIRAYYHETQKLHLQPGAILTDIDDLGDLRLTLGDAYDKGDFSAIAEAVAGVKVKAVLPEAERAAA